MLVVLLQGMSAHGWYLLTQELRVMRRNATYASSIDVGHSISRHENISHMIHHMLQMIKQRTTHELAQGTLQISQVKHHDFGESLA